MAIPIVPMTKEEVENNYTYKVVKRALKQEYPWVIDFILHDEVDKYNLIFFDLLVDPVKMSEYFEVPISHLTYSWFKYKLGIRTCVYVSSIVDMTMEEGSDFQTEIEKFVEGIEKSKNIPEEYRLPYGRWLKPHLYVIPEVPPTPLPPSPSSEEEPSSELPF